MLASTEPDSQDDHGDGAEVGRGASHGPASDARSYVIEREVGRGGAGVVLRARDCRLDRVVAIKQLLRAHPLAKARFEREMRITARLQHPGIVPIHDAGVWASGDAYYAMKLVDGRSLADLISERPTWDARLELLANLVTVAETIAYAHGEGVIHRDLKPGNIVVGSFGETVVIDWGLAKELHVPDDAPEATHEPYRSVDGSLTRLGQVLGTPIYMPPEQARGEPVDERADVYALGAILRELLTGAPPYRGLSRAALDAVIAGPPPPITSLVADAPRDLAAIADKAMAREPRDRYADARSFVDDLRRFLNGRLVRAYSYGARERARKWLRRHRGIAVTSALALASLVAVGTAALVRITRERDRAVASQVAEARARRDADRRAEALLLEQATSELEGGDTLSALAVLARYPLGGEEWVRAGELAVRAALLGAPELVVHPDFETQRLRFDEPSAHLAIVGDGRLDAWNVADGRRTVTASWPGGAGREPELVEPQGRRWLVGLRSGEVLAVDDRGVRTLDAETCAGAPPIALSVLDERRAVLVCQGGGLALLDVAQGARTSLPALAADAPLRSAALVAGRTRLAVTTQDGRLATMAIDGHGGWRELDGDGSFTVLASEPRCPQFLAGTRDGRVLVHDDVRPRAEMRVGRTQVLYAELSPDCRHAVTFVAGDARIFVIDLASGEIVHSEAGPRIHTLTRAGAMVIYSSRSTVDVLELGSGLRRQLLQRIEEPSPPFTLGTGHVALGRERVSVVQLPPDVRTVALPALARATAMVDHDRLVVVGTVDGQVIEVDPRTGAWRQRPSVHDGAVLVAGADRASRYVTAGVGDGCVWRWQPGHGPERLVCLPGEPTDLRLTPDGAEVVVVTGNGWAARVALDDPARARLAQVSAEALKDLSFDAMARDVVTVSASGDMFVLDEALATREHHATRRRGLSAFAPDAHTIVATDYAGVMVSIDRTTGAQVAGDRCRRAWRGAYWADVPRGRALFTCATGEVVGWPDRTLATYLTQNTYTRGIDGSSDGRFHGSGAIDGGIVVRGEGRVRVVRLAHELGELEIDSLGTAVATMRSLPLLALLPATAAAADVPTDPPALHRWLQQRSGGL